GAAVRELPGLDRARAGRRSRRALTSRGAEALVHRQLQPFEVADPLLGQPVLARAVEQQPEVALRRLASGHRCDSLVGEGLEGPAVVGDDGDLEAPIVAAVDTLGAVEMVAGGRIEEVADAPGGGRRLGDEVRHAALARPDGKVEGETMAFEACAADLERLQAAAVNEDRPAEVAAIGEVPERPRAHRRRPPRASCT